MSPDDAPGTFELESGPEGVIAHVRGDWRRGSDVDWARGVGSGLGDARRVTFDARDLAGWDSTLLAVLLRFQKACDAQGIEVDPESLPAGIQRLLRLATAVPKTETQRGEARQPFLERLGRRTIALIADSMSIITFIGESILLLLRFLARKARFRAVDVWLNIQQAGAEALPIVSVINFLIGGILAFVGALQLQKFGASIYVADLVGIGMTREMAPLMTAIIMSGRTGAAYAAQLGTMTVNEEVDALKTFGIPPLEFLVLPRMLALLSMMPLLCLYGMGMGICAGGLAAWGVLDISPAEYMTQTRSAVGPIDLGIGLFKGSVYGALVATCGCLRGMQSGRNAAAVGKAATSAVVTAILLIILADAVFNVLTALLEI